MRKFRVALVGALIAVSILLPARAGTVSAFSHTTARAAKANCQTVTRKKNGKTIKVHMCHKIIQKPLPRTQVSNLDPFAPCNSNGDGSTKNYPNTAVDPSAAINTKNAKNMVTLWQQDVWNLGGARGIVAGYSFDGGKTWNDTPLPFTQCGKQAIATQSHGRKVPASRAVRGQNLRVPRTDSQQVVAFDLVDSESLATSGGTFFAAADPYSINLDGSDTGAIFMSKSTDGGKTWSNPAAVDSIAKSPTDFFAQVQVFPAFQSGGGPGNSIVAAYNRFHDDGKTGIWSSYLVTCHTDLTGCSNPMLFPNDGVSNAGPATFAASGSGIFRFFGGTVEPTGNPSLSSQYYDGSTFSQPHLIASYDIGPRVIIPGSKLSVLGGRTPSAAVDPKTGGVYVAWSDERSISMSKSTDGGVTWSAPQKVSKESPALFTRLIVNSRGRLALVYDAFNLTGANSTTLPVNVNLAVSTDGGATFTETKACDFNAATAPLLGTTFINGLGNDLVPVPGTTFARDVVGDGNKVGALDQVM